VENKEKLLKPILSRFCDIYIHESYDTQKKESINLHQMQIHRNYDLDDFKKGRAFDLSAILSHINTRDISHKDLVKIVETLYEHAFSSLDLIGWAQSSDMFTEAEKSEVAMVFYKIKSEYRCEKMLMFYLFDYLLLRKNKDLKNISCI
jgi:hypothetical protein